MSLQAGDLVRIRYRTGALGEEIMLVTSSPKMKVHVDELQYSREILVVEILGKTGLLVVPVDSVERVEKGKRK